MNCQLVCIPPDMAHQMWPHVEGLIYVAMKKGDLSAFEPVKQAVLSGGSGTLLWIAWDQEKEGRDGIKAAAITELQQTEWRKSCIIVACGGTSLQNWIHFLKPLEDYAKAEGCSRMRIFGRRGWIEYLPGYMLQRRGAIIEKALN